jgi:hypothetical protein
VRKEGKHVVVTPTEARAGYLDRPVLAVLMISTAMGAALLAVLYLAYLA